MAALQLLPFLSYQGKSNRGEGKITHHDQIRVNIAKNPKYDGHQRDLAAIAYNFFDKKYSGEGIKYEIMPYQQLLEELQIPIIRKFKQRKIHPSFIDNL